MPRGVPLIWKDKVVLDPFPVGCLQPIKFLPVGVKHVDDDRRNADPSATASGLHCRGAARCALLTELPLRRAQRAHWKSVPALRFTSDHFWAPACREAAPPVPPWV